MVVEAVGGSYTDEASGTPGVALAEPLVTVGELADGANTLTATPLTTLALNLAARGGPLTAEAFAASADAVRAKFGLPPETDLARGMPDVTPERPNAYGKALIAVSRMLQEGAPLSRLVLASDLDALGKAAEACANPPTTPPVSVDLQADVAAGAPAEGPDAQWSVLAPDPRWRATLPAAGPIGRTACAVTLSSETEVRIACSPLAGLTSLDIYAGGGAGANCYEAQPSSSGLTLAGGSVTLTGGVQRLTAIAPIRILSGEGRLRAQALATGGTRHLYDSSRYRCGISTGLALLHTDDVNICPAKGCVVPGAESTAATRSGTATVGSRSGLPLAGLASGPSPGGTIQLAPAGASGGGTVVLVAGGSPSLGDAPGVVASSGPSLDTTRPLLPSGSSSGGSISVLAGDITAHVGTISLVSVGSLSIDGTAAVLPGDVSLDSRAITFPDAGRLTLVGPGGVPVGPCGRLMTTEPAGSAGSILLPGGTISVSTGRSASRGERGITRSAGDRLTVAHPGGARESVGRLTVNGPVGLTVSGSASPDTVTASR